MTLGAFSSALRLHTQRIAPKWRYGVAAAVAAGAGTAYYTWRRAERTLWSDELKPDPPLPQKYEHKYRLGTHLVNLDMPSSAWKPLNEAWQSALDDGADPAALTAIAAMLLQAKAPADAKHDVGARTLDRLLRAGWDAVLPRDRERAVILALAAFEGGGKKPFLQWAWAQTWHLAVLDAPQMHNPWLVARLANACDSRSILDALPFAIVTAERLEERKRNPGFNPWQRCFLASFYNTLGVRLILSGPTWHRTATEFHHRALEALGKPSDLNLHGKVLGFYLFQLGWTQCQLGFLLELHSNLDGALKMYTSAYELIPEDNALKDIVHTCMLRVTLEAQHAAEPPKKT